MDNKNEEQQVYETYREQIDIWYKVHNIIRERTELYYDFLFSLLTLVDETYLGDDVIQSEEDMMNHFNWCFNKVTSNFEHERIHFLTKNTHYSYLWFMFHKAFYQCTTEDKTQILHEYFKSIFDFNKVKSSIELDTFIDLYKIFDQNLKKIN